jgi:DNA-binding response OmpR family regulator
MTNEIQIYDNISILSYTYKDTLNILEKLGYSNIDIAINNCDIMNKIKNKSYSLLLLDIDKIKSFYNFKKIKKINNNIYIIIINCKDIHIKKYKYYFDAYLYKPLDIYELKALLRIISRKLNQNQN